MLIWHIAISTLQYNCCFKTIVFNSCFFECCDTLSPYLYNFAYARAGRIFLYGCLMRACLVYMDV